MSEQTAEIERLRDALDYLVDMARGHDYAEIAKISDAEFLIEDALGLLDTPTAQTVEGVGTGAGEGATGQDTGTAWVTRSADCPEAPAQAHLLDPRTTTGQSTEGGAR